MEFKILPILAFLSVAVVVSHAALPSPEYWNSLLPSTPMPKPLKDLLTPTSEWREDKRTSVDVGKGGVNVNTGNPGGTTVNVGGGSGVNVNARNNTHVNVGGGGVTVGTRNRKGKPVYVGVTPTGHPFNYLYAATDTQLHDSPTVALFFLEKNLHAGNRMTLHFTRSENQQKFLPRHLADQIPFSSTKLPQIYSDLSINPSSADADSIKKTLAKCEDSPIKGESKFCATSLESMVDFARSELGEKVEAISTAAESGERKVYRIAAVRRRSGKAVVVCHREEYPYAVFYCHRSEATAAYGVSLVGGGGARAEAVAVCHKNTAEWNPKHLAFQVLKVKPGSVPVCHYLPEDHVVWVLNN